MRLDSPLARWFYERLSHTYRQAVKNGVVTGTGYRLSLETILRESGIAVEKRVRDSINAVRRALKELGEKQVLDYRTPYKEELVQSSKATSGRRPTKRMCFLRFHLKRRSAH